MVQHLAAFHIAEANSSNVGSYSDSALCLESHIRFKTHLKTLKWKGQSRKGVELLLRSYDKMCILPPLLVYKAINLTPRLHTCKHQIETHPLHIRPHPQCSLLPYGLEDRYRYSAHSQGWYHTEHLSGMDC